MILRRLPHLLQAGRSAVGAALQEVNARSRRAGGFGALPFVRLGRSVRYRRADVERFIAGAMVNAGGN
ncbi:MAG: hypothetical protein AB7G11_16425 [Phycisphaerales bacterium]